jgi:hypothetical protein
VRAEWHVFEEYSRSNPFERVMAGAPVAFSLHFSNFDSESRADVGYEGGVNPPTRRAPTELRSGSWRRRPSIVGTGGFSAR